MTVFTLKLMLQILLNYKTGFHKKANAAELANGNVLLYSGITEGYDKTDVILQPQTTNDSTGFFVDNAGLYFLLLVMVLIAVVSAL